MEDTNKTEEMFDLGAWLGRKQAFTLPTDQQKLLSTLAAARTTLDRIVGQIGRGTLWVRRVVNPPLSD